MMRSTEGMVETTGLNQSDRLKELNIAFEMFKGWAHKSGTNTKGIKQHLTATAGFKSIEYRQ